MRYEIPMAEADVLTASLRANPVFYADTQLVPYGRYIRDRPGGQTQYDVNITHPLDVCTEAPGPDARSPARQAGHRGPVPGRRPAHRSTTSTPPTSTSSAAETLRFSQAYLKGITRLLDDQRGAAQERADHRGRVVALQAQARAGPAPGPRGEAGRRRPSGRSALMLNMPARSRGARSEVRATLRDVRPLPASEEDLIQTAMALAARPERLPPRPPPGRGRRPARPGRNRLSDVYLLYQPYTFQDNRPFGLKSPTSWALGITVPLPVYNRNQGNIGGRSSTSPRPRSSSPSSSVRSRTRSPRPSANSSSASTPSSSRSARSLPASRKVRDAAYRRWQGGETSALEFLDAQKDYQRASSGDYRDSLVRHRRAMLDLNTAVGTRLLP